MDVQGSQSLIRYESQLHGENIGGLENQWMQREELQHVYPT